MKRIVFGLILFSLLFALVACSKIASTTTTNTTGAAKGTAPLSTEAELLVGTFKLEGTDQAVTAEQARQLLPLWQTLQSLANSNTAATEEMNALVDQIKSTMTTQQMVKITAMKLTQQDVMTVMNAAGVGFNPSGTSATPDASSRSNPRRFPGRRRGSVRRRRFSRRQRSRWWRTASSGGFPAGGDPGITGGQPGQSTTPQAVRPNGFANQVPPPLLNALIQMLQKKTQ